MTGAVTGAVAGALGGAELIVIDGNRPVTLPGLITVLLLLAAGSGSSGGSVVGRITEADDVGALAPEDEDDDEDRDDDGAGLLLGVRLVLGDGLAAGGAVTLTALAATGRSVIGGLVAACAVAVSETVVTAALLGTETAACMVYDEGAASVASFPSWQPAPPFPLGHSPVNTPCIPDGPAVRLTHALGTGP